MKLELKHYASLLRDRLHKNAVKNFEIYIERKRGSKLEVRKGQRDTCEIKSGLGYAVRIFEKNRTGFIYGSDFSESSLNHVIQSCLQTIHFKKADKCSVLVEPQPIMGKPQILDKQFDQIGMQDKLDFLCALETEANKVDVRVADVKTASLDDECEEILLENTKGVSCEMQRSFYCVSLGVQAEEGAHQEIAYDVRTETHFDRLDYRQMAHKAAGQAVLMLGGRPVPSYKGLVLLDAAVMGSLIEIVASSFMGNNISRNNSRLCGKLGQKLYSERITLLDDGLRDHSSGSGPFDAEGTPVQSHMLIDGGKVERFLYDVYWANREGTTTTGNSVRNDVSCQPDLSYHNLILAPGTSSLDELIQTMQNGIQVLDVIGLHNADEVSGDFSVGIQGVWYQQGRPAQAVRSMVMTGNVHKLLNQVEAVGNDFQFVGGVGAPSILCQDVDVSGS